MWRLWTRGWGFHSWVYWLKEEVPRRIAFNLPDRVLLWAFIYVYSYGIRDCPGEEYKQVFDAWVSRK